MRNAGMTSGVSVLSDTSGQEKLSTVPAQDRRLDRRWSCTKVSFLTSHSRFFEVVRAVHARRTGTG